MNCKKVEPLLSLYVGRDLDQRDSQLVAAHLQSCTQCTLAADEYAGARQLLLGYEPPFFSDGIYAGIRVQVLNEIERESHARGWRDIFSQLGLVLVQPRLRWITAALLLAIAVTALNLKTKPLAQLPNDHEVAVQTQEPKQASTGADVRSEDRKESAGRSTVSKKVERRPIIAKRRANAGVVATNRSRELEKVKQPSSAPAPLRLEIQTNDRNIRIIWLSGQRSGADGQDGSKGI